MRDERPMSSFDEWFKRATGHKPYPFKVRFACEPKLLSNPSPSGRGQGEGPSVDVPTGLGNWRFARGIWDDDELPATEPGGGVTAPAARLSLEPMELGLCEHEPFIGQSSWAERMISLRDVLGPFRLVYLEAILRAADMRASREAEKRSLKSPVADEVGRRCRNMNRANRTSIGA
jgi:hypothetical protein